MRRSLSFKRVASFHPDTLLEKISARLFFGDFCDIFKNTFLAKLLRVTASLSRKYLSFLTQRGFLPSLSYFSRQYFNVTMSSLEISKLAINSQFFRNFKSSHQDLEVFFQIIFLIKYLRRSLSLVESCRRTAAFTKTELFQRDLQNVYFNIKG